MCSRLYAFSIAASTRADQSRTRCIPTFIAESRHNARSLPIHNHKQHKHNHKQRRHNHKQYKHNHKQHKHNHKQYKHNHKQHKHNHKQRRHNHKQYKHNHKQHKHNHKQRRHNQQTLKNITHATHARASAHTRTQAQKHTSTHKHTNQNLRGRSLGIRVCFFRGLRFTVLLFVAVRLRAALSGGVDRLVPESGACVLVWVCVFVCV